MLNITATENLNTLIATVQILSESGDHKAALMQTFEAKFALKDLESAIQGGIWGGIQAVVLSESLQVVIDLIRDGQDALKGESKLDALDKATRSKYDTLNKYRTLIARGRKVGVTPTHYETQPKFEEAVKAAEGKVAGKKTVKADKSASKGQGLTEGQIIQALNAMTGIVRENLEVSDELAGSLNALLNACALAHAKAQGEKVAA